MKIFTVEYRLSGKNYIGALANATLGVADADAIRELLASHAQPGDGETVEVESIRAELGGKDVVVAEAKWPAAAVEPGIAPEIAMAEISAPEHAE